MLELKGNYNFFFGVIEFETFSFTTYHNMHQVYLVGKHFVENCVVDLKLFYRTYIFYLEITVHRLCIAFITEV